MSGVGDPCNFSVNQSPFGLGFGTLDFGTSDSGLTIKVFNVSVILIVELKSFRWKNERRSCVNHSSGFCLHD